MPLSLEKLRGGSWECCGREKAGDEEGEGDGEEGGMRKEGNEGGREGGGEGCRGGRIGETPEQKEVGGSEGIEVSTAVRERSAQVQPRKEPTHPTPSPEGTP